MSDVLHLSAIAPGRLVDSNGERIGRLNDLVVRLDSGESASPLAGLKARIDGRDLFVPTSQIARLDPSAISTTTLNLAGFQRRPGQALLRNDLLGRSQVECSGVTG